MRNKTIIHNNNGVALILVLALLAILASFASLITSKARAALLQSSNYKYAAQAQYLAHAGLHRALYELKFHPTAGSAACAGTGITAFDSTSKAWYFTDGLTADLASTTQPSFHTIDTGDADAEVGTTEGINNIGHVLLKITDNASRINLNSPDTGGLIRLLENLFALVDPTIISATATTIVTNRPPLTFDASTHTWSGGYNNTFDIRPLLSAEQMDNINEYLTTHAFIDHKLIREMSEQPPLPYNIPRHATVSVAHTRSPINMNTAPGIVLQCVLRQLPTLSNTEAETLATQIIAHRPFTTWAEVQSFLDTQSTAIGFSATQVMRAINPNRPKDTLYTTEFCFSSGGFFTIESLGRITRAFTAAAMRTLKIEAKLYETFRISTQDDFVGSFSTLTTTETDHDNDHFINPVDEDLHNTPFDPTTPYESLLTAFGEALKPGFQNVTWLDSTPVNPDDEQEQKYPYEYDIIPGAIKLGFWDNFDEDPDASEVMWYIDNVPHYNSILERIFSLNGDANAHRFTGSDANDEDNELWVDYWINDPDDDMIGVPAPNTPAPYSNAYYDSFALSLYPYFDSGNVFVNTYGRWEGSMYLRTSVTEGPRTIHEGAGNIPVEDAESFPGRDYRCSGMVCYRFNETASLAQRSAAYFLSTTGNYYNQEQLFSQDMDDSGSIEWGNIVAARNLTTLAPPTFPLSLMPYDFASPPTNIPGNPEPPNFIDQLNRCYYVIPGPWDIAYQWPHTAESIPFPQTVFSYLRDKTYRTILHGLSATMQVASAGLGNDDFHTLFTNVIPAGLNEGSVILYNNGAHAAWDDIRIIGEEGEYSTAAFSPGDIGTHDETILWGTFAWTESTQGSASVQARLIFAEEATPDETSEYDLQVSYTNNGEGGPIRNGATIAQYPRQQCRVHVNMETAIGSGTQAPDIPIFEDATITFLPETHIYSVRAHD